MNFFSSSFGSASAACFAYSSGVSGSPRDGPGLSGELADRAVELHVGRDERRRARREMLADRFEQLLHLLAVHVARELVQVRLVGLRRLPRLVVAALQPPDVEPLGRRGRVLAEQVVGGREPLVDVLLEKRRRDAARPWRCAGGPCARCRGGTPPPGASVPSSGRAGRRPRSRACSAGTCRPGPRTRCR